MASIWAFLYDECGSIQQRISIFLWLKIENWWKDIETEYELQKAVTLCAFLRSHSRSCLLTCVHIVLHNFGNILVRNCSFCVCVGHTSVLFQSNARLLCIRLWARNRLRSWRRKCLKILCAACSAGILIEFLSCINITVECNNIARAYFIWCYSIHKLVSCQ